jgi:hypothetical protein
MNSRLAIRVVSTTLFGLALALTGSISGARAQESKGRYREMTTINGVIHKIQMNTEQKITRDEATDIVVSLSNSEIWVFDAPKSAYRNWITGFRRDGNRIAITSSWAIQPTWGTWVRERTMKFSVLFPKFCGSPVPSCTCDGDAMSMENNRTYCGVRGDYTFLIESDKKVIVDAVEKWPRIPPIDAQTKKFRFEYTQFR